MLWNLIKKLWSIWCVIAKWIAIIAIGLFIFIIIETTIEDWLIEKEEEYQETVESGEVAPADKEGILDSLNEMVYGSKLVEYPSYDVDFEVDRVNNYHSWIISEVQGCLNVLQKSELDFELAAVSQKYIDMLPYREQATDETITWAKDWYKEKVDEMLVSYNIEECY